MNINEIISSNEDKLRIIQELVPGEQITLAHIIANPDEINMDRIVGTSDMKKIKDLNLKIEEQDKKIIIKATREEIPEIIKKLVENNIKIYSVTENILSLEEAFLKKTGGNVIE